MHVTIPTTVTKKNELNYMVLYLVIPTESMDYRSLLHGIFQYGEKHTYKATLPNLKSVVCTSSSSLARGFCIINGTAFKSRWKPTSGFRFLGWFSQTQNKTAKKNHVGKKCVDAMLMPSASFLFIWGN